MMQIRDQTAHSVQLYLDLHCPKFQHNTKLPYIFKTILKLYVRLNQCIVLFLFSSFDSSPNHSWLFMPLRKNFKKKVNAGY